MKSISKSKKTIITVVASVFFLGNVVGVSAITSLKEITAYLDDSIHLVINGAAFTAHDSDGNKLTPINYNGSTYLPLRSVAEATGLQVKWDDATRTATLGNFKDVTGNQVYTSKVVGVSASTTLKEITAYLDDSIHMVINSATFTAHDSDGNKLTPINYNGSTYLPLRSVAEATGLQVKWDDTTRTATLGNFKDGTGNDETISDFLNKIFTSSSNNADVMTIGLPRDINEKANQITQIMQKSILENKEWYMDALGNLNKGEALPYDKRLGITEEEYTFLLQLNDYMRLIKQKETIISIQKDGTNLIINNDDSTTLKSFTIDTSKNIISTNLGNFSYSNKVVASDGQRVTGRWNGHSWKLEEENKKSFQISIGQMEESNKKIIYIKLQELGKETKEEILIF